LFFIRRQCAVGAGGAVVRALTGLSAQRISISVGRGAACCSRKCRQDVRSVGEKSYLSFAMRFYHYATLRSRMTVGGGAVRTDGAMCVDREETRDKKKNFLDGSGKFLKKFFVLFRIRGIS
jgi:hypothetical protein